MYQLNEGEAVNMFSLECFKSQISLPSSESFTGDILEHMGAIVKNKHKYADLHDRVQQSL